jgi:aryl-alcohol dehydrogenase-like predicted oxidoreductase
MRKGSIGSLEVSVVGVGCNNFGRALDKTRSAAVVAAALDAGVTFFDTARNYGDGRSESFLGAALSNRRDEVVIATKFGPIPGRPEFGGATKPEVAVAVEESLTKLGTDYIDLYQLHFPSSETPIEETLEAMDKLVEQGKVREIGCSNFDRAQLTEALGVSFQNGWSKFVSDQVEYSLIQRDPDISGLTATCLDNDVALLPYYPLASGLLTGKTRRNQKPRGRLQMERYSKFLTEENFNLVEALEDYARQRGLTMVQVALGWLLSRTVVPSVTAGASSPDQVRSNARAAEWQPAPEDLTSLEALINHGEVKDS